MLADARTLCLMDRHRAERSGGRSRLSRDPRSGRSAGDAVVRARPARRAAGRCDRGGASLRRRGRLLADVCSEAFAQRRRRFASGDCAHRRGDRTRRWRIMAATGHRRGDEAARTRPVRPARGRAAARPGCGDRAAPSGAQAAGRDRDPGARCDPAPFPQSQVACGQPAGPARPAARPACPNRCCPWFRSRCRWSSAG